MQALCLVTSVLMQPHCLSFVAIVCTSSTIKALLVWPFPRWTQIKAEIRSRYQALFAALHPLWSYSICSLIMHNAYAAVMQLLRVVV